MSMPWSRVLNSVPALAVSVTERDAGELASSRLIEVKPAPPPANRRRGVLMTSTGIVITSQMSALVGAEDRHLALHGRGFLITLKLSSTSCRSPSMRSAAGWAGRRGAARSRSAPALPLPPERREANRLTDVLVRGRPRPPAASSRTGEKLTVSSHLMAAPTSSVRLSHRDRRPKRRWVPKHEVAHGSSSFVSSPKAAAYRQQKPMLTVG